MIYTNKRNESKTSYFHQRNQGGSQKGGYTVAWREIGDNLVFAVAVCSEKDTFNKKTGRELCDNRLDGISLSEEGAIQVPVKIVDFVIVADIDEVKFRLEKTGAFDSVVKSKALEIINNLTLKELSYSAIIDIFNDINFDS